MITTPQRRIDEYTAKGWWGSDTLHGLLQQAADQHPLRLAVADQPNRKDFEGQSAKRLSFKELESAANNLAEQFLSHGIGLDDKIIVQLPNIVELVVCYYALSKIGAIVSPIPIQYGQNELRKVTTALNAKQLVTTNEFRSMKLAASATDLAAELNLKVLSFGPNRDSEKSQLQLLGEITPNPRLQQYRQQHKATIDNANNIISICWTSGTTGTPKGVPRSHNMWLSTTQAIIHACDYREGDLLLNPFPLVNMAAIGGFLFPAVVQACSLFLHHPLEPAVYLQQLQDEKITFTIAPPALLNQLAKTPTMWDSFDFSSLRCVGSGSAPLAPWMIKVFEQDYQKEIVNFYGSNEGICLLATAQTAPSPEQRASMFPRLGAAAIPWQGGAYEFANTRVADPTTDETINQANQAGELLIQGPTIFDGYFIGGGEHNSNSHEKVFSQDGFFRTGDLVEICGEPALHYRIVGRCKDIINRGGVKISPSEIDQILESYPQLKEAVVCAYADDRLGEKVCACVVTLDGQPAPSLAQIVEHLQTHGLATFKLPERLEIFDTLPRNPMNKILRFELSDVVNKRSC